MQRLVRQILVLACLLILTASPTANAQIAEHLSGGALRILVPAPGEPTIAEHVQRGEVFAAFPVQYAVVGRLQNDIYSHPLFGGTPRLLIPAGTPTFQAQIVLPTGVADRRAIGPAYWCTVAPLGNVQRTFCWQDNAPEALPGTISLGHVRSDFPVHFPVGNGLSGHLTATRPQVRIDESAHGELPPMEFVYVLNNPRNCGAYVRAGVRLAGEVHVFSGVNYACDDGRSQIGFPAGDGNLRLTADGDNAAVVVIRRQPRRYVHPNERSLYDGGG